MYVSSFVHRIALARFVYEADVTRLLVSSTTLRSSTGSVVFAAGTCTVLVGFIIMLPSASSIIWGPMSAGAAAVPGAAPAASLATAPVTPVAEEEDDDDDDALVSLELFCPFVTSQSLPFRLVLLELADFFRLALFLTSPLSDLDLLALDLLALDFLPPLRFDPEDLPVPFFDPSVTCPFVLRMKSRIVTLGADVAPPEAFSPGRPRPSPPPPSPVPPATPEEEEDALAATNDAEDKDEEDDDDSASATPARGEEAGADIALDRAADGAAAGAGTEDPERPRKPE